MPSAKAILSFIGCCCKTIFWEGDRRYLWLLVGVMLSFYWPLFLSVPTGDAGLIVSFYSFYYSGFKAFGFFYPWDVFSVTGENVLFKLTR